MGVEDNPFQSSKAEPLPEPQALAGAPAWQPLTPRGVAAFSGAGIGRLLLVELVVALLFAGALGWFVAANWLPVTRSAIAQLPEEGVIRSQRLISPRTSPEPLASSPFLTIGMDLGRRSNTQVGSDFYVRFHETDFQICSFLGCLVLSYPRDYIIQFNRTEMEAGYGAWIAFVIGGLLLIVVLGLFLAWGLLATVYCPVVRLVAWFRQEQIGLAGCWKMASAALMPGALLMTAGVVGYSSELLGLIQFCLLGLLHLLVGWVYIFLSPRNLPRTTQDPANPFAT